MRAVNGCHGDKCDETLEHKNQENTLFKKNTQSKIKACQSMLQLIIQIYKCTLNKYHTKDSCDKHLTQLVNLG